jgi:tyrosine-protein kinase Etk/Wzc
MAETPLHTEDLQHEKEVHLLDYLHVVQRRWRIAVIVFLLVFVGVAVKTFMETPIYQSSVTLRVGYKQQPSEIALKLNLENRFSIASELRVLQSYSIAEMAAARLGLQWQQLERSHGFDVQIQGLDVPEDVEQLTLELTGATSYRLFATDGKEVLQGESDELVEVDGYRALVTIRKGEGGDRVALRRLSHDEAVGLVMSGISASELEEGTNLIGLSVQGPDPLQITAIANALAEAYVEQNRLAKSAEAASALLFINQQKGELGTQLDQSEQALNEYRIKTGLDRLSAEGQSLVDIAVELEKRRVDLNLQLKRITTFLDEFKWDRDDFTAVGGLPGIDEFISQLVALRASRLDLLRKYTAAHPEVIEVDNQVSQLREKIRSTVLLAQKRIEQELADVKVSLAQSTRVLEQMPEEELELVRLSRANQVNAELYSYLLQRQQETRIAAASTGSNVDIIDRAQVPQAPIKPNTRKNLALGLILGLMLGVGLTFLLDYLDRTIKDEEDVREKLSLPVIGNIPRIMAAEENEEQQLVTQLEPMSIAAEAFLALRTNLLYTITHQKHRTVLLTSCMPDEGKSTVAVNLAAALAQTGARTLLVGCDLRRPSLYKALGQAEIPGLTDLIVNGDQTAVRRIEHLNLDFIPAGTEPPNPTQLLNSEKMHKFMEVVNHKYDYVVLDAPPLLPVADALILASRVDLNVLVIESCRVSEKLVKRVLRSLQNHGACIAGVVLNDKSGKGAKYYGGSYYYSKDYQGYYRRNEKEIVPPLWRRMLLRVWDFING